MYRFMMLIAAIAAVAMLPIAAQAAPKTQTPPKSHCKKQKKCEPVVEGRMTGHGHQFTSTYGKVQWEFRNSVCNSDRFPDLKVEFGGQRFILTSYSTPLTCFTLNPNAPSTEGNPRAGFDSIRAQGTGTLDGVAGHSITFRFTDAGEPGRADTAQFTITGPDGGIVYDGGALDGGNHQAHRK